MNVAVFRPDDDRLADAVDRLASLGVEPVPDPLLAVEPTGAVPRGDADVTVLTSKTGVELAAEAGWTPGGQVVAIGGATAEALRAAGYEVDRTPEEYSSAGLVRALEDDVTDARVEVARSDHGSDVLTDGLTDAGADVHETVLYRLVRPQGAGESVELAARDRLAGALFTSSLTVEHFLAVADERGVRDAAMRGLDGAVVGAIGEPTRSTAADAGIEVDVVPDRAEFDELARRAVEELQSRSHDRPSE